MAWKCSQCGEINENMSVIKCLCGHEMTQVEQSAANADSLDVKYAKITPAGAIIVAIFLMLVLSAFTFLLPRNDFLDYYAWIAVQCIIIYWLHKQYPLKVFPIGNKAWKYGFIAGIIILCIDLSSYVIGTTDTPADYDIFVNYTVLWKSLFILNLVVLAPVVEEILFRGFFYRILRDRYDIFWGGLISILLFAAVHNFEASSFLHGLIFTYVYEKSGSVWGSMIAHALNNFGYAYFHYLI